MFALLSFLIYSICLNCASVYALRTVFANDSLVQKMGRVYAGPQPGSVAFEWLGGGFRISHTGNTLWMTPLPTSAAYKISFAQSNENFFAPQGAAWVTPSSNSTPIIIASGQGIVRVTLNIDPQYWAPYGTVGAISFTTDGDFESPSQNPLVLHFIGDSITAATNVHGGIVPCGDAGYESDYLASWAGIVCSALDADCSTVAVGGRGLVRNCCNTGPPYMPEYYTWMKYSAPIDVPFAKISIPAAILVYLGTNDYSNPVPGLDEQFTAGLVAFMFNATKVWYGTSDHPANITFFLILGPMSPTLPAKATQAAIAEGTAAGYKAILVNATSACGSDLRGCSDGCAGHPGVVGHWNIAMTALPLVRSALS